MERPDCKYCGKPLRKDFDYFDWTSGRPVAIEKRFAGFGFCGNNYFCSKSCGYCYAVDVCQMDAVRKQQREAASHE